MAARRIRFFVLLRRWIATVIVLAITAVAVALIWQYYVVAPWTRDGRVRVLVASVAPQVSGQIIELRVTDNQIVHKGDVLYVIDPFDYETKLGSARAQVKLRAADLQVKRTQADRRQALTLATSIEEKQKFAGDSVMADAQFADAQVLAAQAEVNLKRTLVRSPVDGYITNLQLRVGDYANTGSANVSIVDMHSFWIDGYFEETKLANICVGDEARAELMGFAQPIIGRVESIGRGISVSDAMSSTQGLPAVNPVYTWVRLAQRVPVRIALVGVPDDIPLASGLTTTVRIRTPGAEDGTDTAFWPGFSGARDRLMEFFDLRHAARRRCTRPDNTSSGVNSRLSPDKPGRPLAPSQINPGLAPSMVRPPQPGPGSSSGVDVVRRPR